MLQSYTSLPEFNAVLKLYNVMADRGNKESIMYKNKGLTYRILDEKGNKIGMPTKASEFYNKPTLKNLERKFVQNEELRLQYAQRLRTYVDWSLRKENSLRSLCDRLKKENIVVMARQNAEGRIYGLTFIDLKTQSVFNGSDLGRLYSAQVILSRCQANENMRKQKLTLESNFTDLGNTPSNQILQVSSKLKDNTSEELNFGREHFILLDELLRVERNYESLPWELRHKNKLRKRQKPM